MDFLTKDALCQMFEKVSARMAEESALLCEMDAKLGDGDLGLTMKKGFSALHAALSELPETDLGKLLMKAGMKMASAVPSTMGTLMGSGVMQGGKAIAGASEMSAQDAAKFLQGYAAGIQNRGKCNRGDRTVLDAIGPAADEAAKAASENASLADVFAAALKGAKEGLESTRNMAPKFGKAAVHAAQCAGEIDQGAYAVYCVISAMAEYVCE